MEHNKLNLAVLFEKFKEVENYHVFSIFEDDAYVSESKCDSESLNRRLENELYKLEYKDEYKLIFKKLFSDKGDVLTGNDKKISYVLNAHTGILSYHLWHKDIAHVFLIQEGYEVMYKGCKAVFLELNEVVKKDEISESRKLSNITMAGVLIIPFLVD